MPVNSSRDERASCARRGCSSLGVSSSPGYPRQPRSPHDRRMTMETNRSNRTALVFGLAVVGFAVGITVALWGVGQVVTRVIGAIGIAVGLFLLTSRNLFKRDAGVSPDLQIAAEHAPRVQMRVLGATAILIGVAQFIPNMRLQIAVTLCAAAVSMAGAFKVPRRIFSARSDAK